MKQRLALVQQSREMVTVAEGGTPVLEASASCESQIVMAVNFLRAGCPSVQIFLNGTNRQDDAFNSAKELLGNLQLVGETLNLNQSSRASYSAVFVVTRHV